MADAPLIVGLGNELRGDDAAGLSVVELLTAAGVAAVRCDGEPIEVLELMRGREHVILIDAAAGERPGRIWHIEAAERELPLELADRSSTHLVGLAEAIGLARALGMLPARLEVIAIEGDRFRLGTKPSTAVEEAAAQVATAIRAGLEAAQTAVGPSSRR